MQIERNASLLVISETYLILYKDTQNLYYLPFLNMNYFTTCKSFDVLFIFIENGFK